MPQVPEKVSLEIILRIIRPKNNLMSFSFASSSKNRKIPLYNIYKYDKIPAFILIGQNIFS